MDNAVQTHGLNEEFEDDRDTQTPFMLRGIESVAKLS
jgi:hypothetical protein